MKTTKVGKLVTKGGARGENKTIASTLLNQYGPSYSFSRRKEDGSYEDAVEIVYASGHREPLGKFNNEFVTTDDPELLEHWINCLRNSFKRNKQFTAKNNNQNDLDEI